MIYATPILVEADRVVLRLIEDQRRQLRHYVSQNPVRWTGFLRRQTLARAIQGSNSIEGYNATLAEAVAIVDDEKPETAEEETVKALTGYRVAMTYVLQLHEDPGFELSPQFIKSLHFMMLNYDMTKSPGQWRPSEVFVVNDQTGERVYDAPDALDVSSLVKELCEQIASAADVDSLVTGAMAHLNLTMIHPFRDGNGRMARALQTLVLARDGVLSPVFSSIEEWLGRNTQAYYAILAEVGKGRWSPQNDALPWVRFCLRAHYQQAATLIRRNAEIGEVWNRITEVLRQEKLPGRTELALMDALYSGSVRAGRYRSEHEISDVVASRDFRRLSDADLLMPVGEKRGRYYVPTPRLRALRNAARPAKSIADPYTLFEAMQQPQLPGL